MGFDFKFFLIGYGKTVSHVVIGLKTAKGTKQLKLDPSIYESLQKEKVEVGDVIYIEANSGAVKVCHVDKIESMKFLYVYNLEFVSECCSQSKMRVQHT